MGYRLSVAIILPLLLILLSAANTKHIASSDPQQAAITATIPPAVPTPTNELQTGVIAETPVATDLVLILEFLKVFLSWPVLLAAILFAFREPLTQFLSDMGQRATKISIAQFSVELPASHGPPPVWTGSELTEALQSSVTRSGDQALRDQFDIKDPFDHLIVDIGTGRQWLTSRLFLFTTMLHRMNRLQCVVFLYTKESMPRKFLGVAYAEQIRWALAHKYPWLEVAYISAYRKPLPVLKPEEPAKIKRFITNHTGALDRDQAKQIVTYFLRAIQFEEPQYFPISSPLPQEFEQEWERLVRIEQHDESSFLERGKWLTEERIRTDLHSILYTDAFVRNSPDMSAIKRQKAIINRQGRFVALVDEEKVFQKLINRQALLEEIGGNLAKPVDD